MIYETVGAVGLFSYVRLPCEKWLASGTHYTIICWYRTGTLQRKWRITSHRQRRRLFSLFTCSISQLFACLVDTVQTCQQSFKFPHGFAIRVVNLRGSYHHFSCHPHLWQVRHRLFDIPLGLCNPSSEWWLFSPWDRHQSTWESTWIDCKLPTQPGKITINATRMIKTRFIASLNRSRYPVTRESLISSVNTPHLFPTPGGWYHPSDQCLSDSTLALHHQLIGPVEALFSKRQKLVRPKKPGFSKAHFACRNSQTAS